MSIWTCRTRARADTQLVAVAHSCCCVRRARGGEPPPRDSAPCAPGFETAATRSVARPPSPPRYPAASRARRHAATTYPKPARPKIVHHPLCPSTAACGCSAALPFLVALHTRVCCWPLSAAAPAPLRVHILAGAQVCVLGRFGHRHNPSRQAQHAPQAGADPRRRVLGAAHDVHAEHVDDERNHLRRE
eukprot:scaffold28406_cov112-Isochrysis_galbana.AAC.4